MVQYSRYVQLVKTKDLKEVSLCIQAVDEIDMIVLEKIENDVLRNMMVAQALNGNIQHHTIMIMDSNNRARRFSVCFILTYDKNCLNVIDAHIVSFVEIS